MTSPHEEHPAHQDADDPPRPPPPPRDRRRIDPETGAVREPPAGPPSEATTESGAAAMPGGADDDILGGAAAQLAEERLVDLQRLQAEYVNYRKRVERDRAVARDQAVAGVMDALLPVLDDIELARQHGDLEGGPFASIADKLDAALTKFGLARYGETGEPFDPSVHEALMHAHGDDVEVATVTQVLQPGYRLGDKVVRAARVAVTEPA